MSENPRNRQARRVSCDEIADRAQRIDFSDGTTFSVVPQSGGYDLGPGDRSERLVAAAKDLHKSLIDAVASGSSQNSRTMLIPSPAMPEKFDPPGLAEFLLVLFTPKRRAKYIIGDLGEQFARKCEELGHDRAVRWYWAEMLRSLWPLLWRAICKAMKWGAIIDWARWKAGL
jgi:hypothetical protein